MITVALRQGDHVGRGEACPYPRYGETIDGVVAQLESVRAWVEADPDRARLQAACTVALAYIPHWNLNIVTPDEPGVLLPSTGGVGRIEQVAIREHREPFYPKVGDWNRFSANTGGTLVEKCCHYFNLMDLVLGERREMVHGVTRPRQSRSLIRELPEFQHPDPIGGVAFPFSFATGPALEVADRGVRVNAGHFAGIGDGPVIAIKPAAAQSHQRRPGTQAVTGGEFRITLIPKSDRRRAAQQVGHLQIDNMEAPAQQGDIRVGFVAEELAMPDPGPARRRGSRGHHREAFSGQIEVMPHKSIP